MAKARFGILDWQPIDTRQVMENIREAGTSTLLPEVFDAGVTIAYDKFDRIPVATQDTVAVIYPGQRTLIFRECGQYHPAIQWLPVSNAPTSEEIANAVALARRVQTVIVFTRNAVNTPAQVNLVRALPADKTVAVALYSPYDMVLFPQVGGIYHHIRTAR